jgi:catechol 2,3-dioxygenase-like lactoylglutathione lyase family enzyme
MKPGISLITLGVADLARARRFSCDGLGWAASSVGGDEVVFLRTSGAILALWPREKLAADANLPAAGSGFGGIALAHNVPNREDVDAVLAEAVAAGGRLLKPAEDASWGGRSGYFADPDGYPWEVAWNPGFPLAPDGTVQLPD